MMQIFNVLKYIYNHPFNAENKMGGMNINRKKNKVFKCPMSHGTELKMHAILKSYCSLPHSLWRLYQSRLYKRNYIQPFH